MNYTTELAAILNLNNALDLAKRRLGWDSARTTPISIDRTVTSRMDVMKQDEAFRRLRTEHPRVAAEITAEESRARFLAASVARFNIEPRVAELDSRYRAYIDTKRRDVALSFAGALDYVDANGMIALELLRETLRARIAAASVAELSAAYQSALERKTARGLVEAELIEQRVLRGGIATKPEEIGAAKDLAELVATVQDTRLDEVVVLGKVAETLADARRVVSLAELVHVRAANPEKEADAKAAFESTAREFAADLAAREAREAAGQ